MFETCENALSPGLANGASPRLGIIGGGQLARMTALASLELGCDVVVLERSAWSPAARLATYSMTGDWNDPATLLALAARSDVVILENEFVNADSLAALEQAGHPLWPRSATLAAAWSPAALTAHSRQTGAKGDLRQRWNFHAGISRRSGPRLHPSRRRSLGLAGGLKNPAQRL